MHILVKLFNIIVGIGLCTAFVKFEDDVEYKFSFKSKLEVSPEILGGGQLANATLIARKFGTDGTSLVIRIKDSSISGKFDSEAKTNIEGIFGIVRNNRGEITHIISKSTYGKELLTKQNIVTMLANDFSFFYNYMSNSNSRPVKQRLPLSVGWCDTDITGTTDPVSELTEILAQSAKSKCDMDAHVLKAGQYLLHGTTNELGTAEDDSNFGMSVIFNTKTERIMQVSKFVFLNVNVGGFKVQARHSMVLNYVSERHVSSETTFEKPYVSQFKGHISNENM